MVQYKVLLTPQVLVLGMKNTDGTASTDYGYLKRLVLQEPASEVYIRRIRFTLAIDHKTLAKDRLFHPYQFHLRWLNGYKRREMESDVLPNSISHSVASPELIDVEYIEPEKRPPAPSYSTFVTLHSFVQSIEEPKPPEASASSVYNGLIDFYYYDMERNDLILEGPVYQLNFEVFFTNLGGKQYFRHLPNIELDLEVV